MKSIARMSLKPGMEIAENVYSYDNKLILKKDTILEAADIKKLAIYSIVCISIKDAEDYATTHFEKLRLTNAFQNFERVYKNNLNVFKFMTNNLITKGTPINMESLMLLHNNVRACATSGEQLLDMLYNMLPSEDDMTYVHCFNSALVCNVFGQWLCISKEDIVTLTLCGFFYDIGKMKLPNNLIWKPGKLTDLEYDWIKTHTDLGYDILKNSGLNSHILNCALMHHERCDGSGYPNHLTEDKIDFFSKCISIVDSYEAMTSARIYRTSLNPFQIINDFENKGLEKYSIYIIKPILEHIANNQLGKTVRLSDDTIGEVIYINKDALAYPLIKVNNTVIDLSLKKDIDIKYML